MREVKKRIVWVLVFVSVVSLVFAQSAESIKNSSPDELKKLQDVILVREIERSPSLLDDNEVLNEFNRRLESDIGLLNQNKYLREKWFSKYGVIDKGAVLGSFKDGVIKTVGSVIPTSFNVNDFSGAKLGANGELIIFEKEVRSGDGLRNVEQIITFDGEVQKSDDGSIVIKGFVSVSDGDTNRRYFTEEDKSISVRASDKGILIKGDITETDEAGNTVSNFKGEIVNYLDGRRGLIKGTVYTSFTNDKKATTYSVNENVEYVKGWGSCEDGAGCIREIPGSVEVKDLKENMEITQHDSSIRKFIIGEIKGEPIVLRNTKGSSLIFEKGSLKSSGNIAVMPEIEYHYRDESGELKKFPINPQNRAGFYSVQGNLLSGKDYIKDGKDLARLDFYLGFYGISLEGKRIVAAYDINYNREVFRTADNEFFVIDGGYSKVYYKKGDGDLMIVDRRGNMKSVEGTYLFPLTRRTIDDEIKARVKYELPRGARSRIPDVSEVDDMLKTANILRNSEKVKKGWGAPSEIYRFYRLQTPVEESPPSRKGPYDWDELSAKKVAEESWWFFGKYIPYLLKERAKKSSKARDKAWEEFYKENPFGAGP